MRKLVLIAVIIVVFVVALVAMVGIGAMLGGFALYQVYKGAYEVNQTNTTNYAECAAQQCHGPDYTCGVVREPMFCTAEQRLGDWCDAYFSCEVIQGTCAAITTPEYQTCASCAKQCEADGGENCSDKCSQFFKDIGAFS